MFLEIPYTDLLVSHPDAVKEALNKLRKGKSKVRSDPPESFTWGFEWCVEIDDPRSIHDILSGQRLPRSEQEVPIEDRVRDYARRCGVCVVVRKGHASSVSKQLSETPEVILAQYRNGLNADHVEQARLKALSPEERERERQDILSQLRKVRLDFIDLVRS